MAKLFDDNDRVVSTWLAVSRYLLTCSKREAQNLVLEISNPTDVSMADRNVMSAVDNAIRAHHPGLSLATVMATIFPQNLYKRHGRPKFYEFHHQAIKRAGKKGWGTYAGRMMRRRGKDGVQIINPLEIIVEKLKSNARVDAKQSFVSTYELGTTDPSEDLHPSLAMEIECGADLPTYDAAYDANRPLGGPCLSHISFKLLDRKVLNMTAIYRSHYYCERALGNLLGLSQLLNFVATEAKLQVGTLTCISTHAKLDTNAWGGVAEAKKILM
jgi:hypothetical protein